MRLYIVTPLGVVIDRDEVTEVSVKSSTGWLGILPGHEDLITPLVPAVIHYKTKVHIYDLVITTGVMNIEHNLDQVTIVADALFYKHQIDYKLVSELLENAEKRLKATNSKKEHQEVELVIAEQKAKLNLLDYPGRQRLNQ